MGVLSGRRAVVTGAGRGIGHVIARRFAAEGAQVVLTARTASEIEAAAGEIKKGGGIAAAVPADIGNEADVQQMVAEAVRIMGGVDILVNNAGIGVFRKVVDLSAEEMDRMWMVNVRGVFLATRAVLPHMIGQKRGDIVSIASLAGKNTFVGGAGYGATKWALRGFMGSLMLEVREHNIRTITIFPGSVDTGFSPQSQHGEHITQPEDVAQAAVFAVTAAARTMVSEIDLRPTNPR
jgi:3-oxoacyl-[acyl-carrier protein] reductase